MPQVNNEFWQLALTIGYRKIRRLTENVPCPCKSMFCQIESDYCRECRGTGFITKELPYPEKPRIPDDLVLLLEKTYKEYVEKN